MQQTHHKWCPIDSSTRVANENVSSSVHLQPTQLAHVELPKVMEGLFWKQFSEGNDRKKLEGVDFGS